MSSNLKGCSKQSETNVWYFPCNPSYYTHNEFQYSFTVIPERSLSSSDILELMWGHPMSCELMWGHPMSCDVMWCHVRSPMSCDVMWGLQCHVSSCDVMSAHVMSWDVTRCHRGLTCIKCFFQSVDGGHRGTHTVDPLNLNACRRRIAYLRLT